MVGQFSLKSLESLHPSTTSMKIKALIHSHMFQQICQMVRAVTKMKSMLMQLVNKKDSTTTIKRWKSKKHKKKSFFSSITMHYNWCSNSVIPMPELQEGVGDYYDSTWNASLPGGEYGQSDGLDDPNLSGYLQWLEEKAPESCGQAELDEIDRLADKFIASCHEKFRLEKQESYRRYQEMLARSM